MQGRATLETITPVLAEQWLETMVPNRKVSDTLTLDYAIAMEAGGWSVNGETIKFDAKGRLFDGQHRLRACVLARKEFSSYVVRGLSDTRAFSTVDSGKHRSHADIFSIDGWANASTAAAAAQIVCVYRERRITWGGVNQRHHKKKTELMKGLNGRRVHQRQLVGKDELVRFAHSIQEQLQAAVRFAHGHKTARLMYAANVAACYLLFSEKSRTQAQSFFDDLAEGTGLKATDPVWVLRERLIQLGRNKARTFRWAAFGLAIKAWNKRRAGESIKALHANEAENFPVVE